MKIAIFYFFTQEMARWCSWIADEAIFFGGNFYHKNSFTSTILFLRKGTNRKAKIQRIENDK